jgi:hypothetical protein
MMARTSSPLFLTSLNSGRVDPEPCAGTHARTASAQLQIRLPVVVGPKWVQRPLLADGYAVAGGNDEKAARILRVSPGYGIWMLLQPLDVARKPRSGPQTAITAGASTRPGSCLPARRAP